jgi:hypothetical protein
MLSIHDLFHGESDDPATQHMGNDKSDSSQESHHSSSHNMEITDPLELFNQSPDHTASLGNQATDGIDRICSDLQGKLNLDSDHLKIALLASKVGFHTTLLCLLLTVLDIATQQFAFQTFFFAIDPSSLLVDHS